MLNFGLLNTCGSYLYVIEIPKNSLWRSLSSNWRVMRVVIIKKALLVILLQLFLVGCLENGDDRNQIQEFSPHEKNILELSAQEMINTGITETTIKLSKINLDLTLHGTVNPNQSKLAKVVSPVSGRIANINFNQGDSLLAGQEIATIESVDLADAQSDYEHAKSSMAVAKAAFHRTQLLVEEGIVARKAYLEDKATLDKANAELKAAKNKLLMFNLDPDSLPVTQTGVAIFPITAPFDGSLIRQDTTRGEYIQANQPIFTITDLDVVWLEANVYENELAKLKVGMPAKVHVSAYPDHEFEGKLVYVDEVMDLETHTVKARFAVENPDHKLKIGMFADVMVNAQSGIEAFVVPEQAVSIILGQSAVFIDIGQGFDVRVVETEDIGDGKVRIKKGLAEGDRIAVSGIYELKARLLKSQISSDD